MDEKVHEQQAVDDHYGGRVFLNLRQTAALLGISERLLDGLVRNGEIPSALIGRRRVFVTEDVVEWVRSRYDAQRSVVARSEGKQECRSSSAVQYGGSTYATRKAAGELDTLLKRLTSKPHRNTTTG